MAVDEYLYDVSLSDEALELKAIVAACHEYERRHGDSSDNERPMAERKRHRTQLGYDC